MLTWLDIIDFQSVSSQWLCYAHFFHHFVVVYTFYTFQSITYGPTANGEYDLQFFFNFCLRTDCRLESCDQAIFLGNRFTRPCLSRWISKLSWGKIYLPNAWRFLTCLKKISVNISKRLDASGALGFWKLISRYSNVVLRRNRCSNIFKGCRIAFSRNSRKVKVSLI